MLNGFYTAASGVLMQQRTLNVLSNNLANIKTPGFRAERVLSETFDHELLTRMEKNNSAYIGAGSPIRIMRDVETDVTALALQQTERPFDVAINGDGYFNIQGQTTQEGQEAQTYLTRNGSFDIDEEGYLILPNRGRVLGQKGEILIEGADFQIDQDGRVYNGEGRLIDTLLITRPAQGYELNKETNGMYTAQLAPQENAEDGQANNNAVAAEPTEIVTNTQVIQGALEQSNVDINRELTLVMEAQRTFQACSQALKIYDTMNQKASTQIASL